MSTLAALQARFVADIVGTGGAPLESIRSSLAFPAPQRFAVYANAYRRRLVEALAAVYERCLEVIGEEAFEAQALDYVEAHPPASRALRWYGDDFPDWLRTRSSAAPLMADLAIIDRGLRRAFDAADASALTRDALLALAPMQWAQLRLAWHPALSVATCAADAIALWRGESAPAAAMACAGPTPIAFWRHDSQTFFRSLAAPEAELLKRLRADATLAEACLEGHRPMAIEAAAAALLAWIDAGWVSAIRTDESAWS